MSYSAIQTAGERAAIRLDNVSKRFGAFVAVENLTFAVAPGEIVALIGKTGAGKSTALNIIMGNMPVSGGTVRVAGVDPYQQFADLRGRIAVGFQTDRLLPWRTAIENIEFGLQVLRIPRAECRRRAKEWLGRVKLGDAAEKYPHELSGGMRQRVSLARALAVDPAIILLDECFSQLDHVTSQTLRQDVSALIRGLGKTCILITHRIDDAIEMAGRVIVLSAPARVALEVAISDEQRRCPHTVSRLHDQLVSAMGDDVNESPSAERLQVPISESIQDINA